jgi:hypothetical protein
MSARQRGAPKKGLLFRWLDEVEEHSRTNKSLTTAQRSAIRLVADKRARCADSDGRNCFPSQKALADFAGVTRDMVRLVDRQLEAAGLMELEKQAGRGTSRRYRLVILASLDDRGDGHSTEGKMTVQTVIQDQEDDRQDDRQGDRGDGHHLLPPTVREEEEESASARSAYAPLAALSSTPVPVDLFSDDPMPQQQGGTATRPSVPSDLDPELVKSAHAIVRRARMDIDPGRSGLAREMTAAKARAGWSDLELVAYCAGKLRRARPKDPTAWLATDLRTRVTESTIMPNLRAEYGELLDKLDALSPGDALDEPIIVLEELLSQEDLIGPEEGIWDDMPEEHLEQAIKLAKQVLAKAKA